MRKAGRSDSKPEAPAQVSSDVIRLHLDKMLASKEFVHSESLKRFLRYIVEQVIQGQADRVKEYLLGVEVFGRKDTFDPRIDPIVRVQAGKLRSRLERYYSNEGSDDTVVIDLPKGGYVPVFRTRDAKNAKTGKRPPVRLSKLLVAALLAVVAGAIALTWWLASARSQAPPPVLTRLTFATGSTSAFPAISRDGNILAFSSDRSEDGNLDLFVQELGIGDPVHLTYEPGMDRQPDFSPSGVRIAFRSDRGGGGVYVISLLSRAQKKIAGEGFWPRFSPDGDWISFIGPNHTLRIVAAAGGPPRVLYSGPVPVQFSLWTPDGGHVLALVHPNDEEVDWWVFPLDGGNAVSTGAGDVFRRYKLGNDKYPPVPGGWIGNRLVFSAGRGRSASLWQIPISLKTWRVDGPPERLTSGPGVQSFPSVAPEARGGPRIVFVNEDLTTNLWGLPVGVNHRKPVQGIEQLTHDASLLPGSSGAASFLSADGSKLVFCSARSGNPDVWLKDLSTGEESPVATNPWPEKQPLVSPDGSRVVYVSRRNRVRAIQIWNAGQGGVTRKVCENCGRPLDWVGNGPWILVAAGSPSRLRMLNTSTGESSDMIEGLEYTLQEADVSADGRWIAVSTTAIQQGYPSSFLAPLSNGSLAPPAAWVSLAGLEPAPSLRWSPDGALIYFFSDRDGFPCLWGQRLDPVTKHPANEPFAVHHFHRYQRYPAWPRAFAVAADKLAVFLASSASSVWMLELSPSASGEARLP